MTSRAVIQILTDYYLPGYKAGGPVRTLSNMVECLGDQFEFLVVTRDRDLGEEVPYESIKPGAFGRIGKTVVRFLAPSQLSFRALHGMITSSRYDVLYLNSFFSLCFTIKPLLLRRLGLLPNRPVILAPRGEFSPGALNIKGTKKRLYICVAKYLGVYRDIVWQASSKYEADDIRRHWGGNSRIVVAPDFSGVHSDSLTGRKSPKRPGFLQVVFLSRISEMKNLHFALNQLTGVKGRVQMDVFGPLEDKEYWSKCQGIIKELPDDIKVDYCGELPHDQVADVLSRYDLFFLPTRGENFGHAILEALSAGCPVLISDRTPWRGLLDHKVGWDVPLEDAVLFQKILQECIDMDEERLKTLSISAREYGISTDRNRLALELNSSFFDLVLTSTAVTVNTHG